MSTDVALPSAKLPDRLGQHTAVEQSRAVAEVQAAVMVAQAVPRDVSTAVALMRESCAQRALADRAFFRYNRGGGQITGPSIHLARELARCWGNVQYGIHELRRDDSFGQSEMQAWAWDVQTNSRAVTTFVVEHKRDTTQGTKALTDQRDIYENNANNGARRLREQIFAILPAWFVEEAKELCNKALQTDASGKTLPQQAADVVSWFAGRLNVTEDQLTDKLGRPVAQWTVQDLAQLRVIGGSLTRGESTVEVEFAPQRLSAAAVTAPAAPRGRTKAKEPSPSPVTLADVPAAYEDPRDEGEWPPVAHIPADGDGEPDGSNA